jgi:iron(III) transport system substrate-binding protein
MTKRRNNEMWRGRKLARRSVVAGGIAAGAALIVARPMRVFAQAATTIRTDVPGLEPKLDELYAKAKAAGETQVIYYGNRTQLWEALNPTFAKRFPGIEFKMERYAPTAGAARVLAEVQRGPSCDLFEGSFMQAKALNDRDVFDRVDWPAMGIPEERIGYPGTVQTFQNLMVHAFNPKRVKREELPKTNADFLDPKWKGMLVTNDFQLTAHLAFWVLATEKFDWAVDWVNKLKTDQQMVITGTIESSIGLVTQGTKPMQVFGSFQDTESYGRQGGDVDSFGTQHMAGVTFLGAVIKNARSPNAAKLLALYLLTDEAQGLIWNYYFVGWGRGTRYMGEYIKKNNYDVVWETPENYLERATITGRLRKALGLA